MVLVPRLREIKAGAIFEHEARNHVQQLVSDVVRGLGVGDALAGDVQVEVSLGVASSLSWLLCFNSTGRQSI